MSLGESMKSFTPQQMLIDAEQEFADAIYRFRQAEDEKSTDYTKTKLEMLRLEAKVRMIRSRIYDGSAYKLFQTEVEESCYEYSGCPKPMWNKSQVSS